MKSRMTAFLIVLGLMLALLLTAGPRTANSARPGPTVSLTITPTPAP